MKNFLLLSRFLLFTLFASLTAFSAFAAPGDLDVSFGNGGIVTTSFVNTQTRANALVRQSDGKLVAVGIGGESEGFNWDFAIVRYNQNGSLDASFGSGGKVTTDFFGNNDSAQTVAIQPDGKIVVGGLSRTNSVKYGFTLARYNTDGSLDLSFGTGGKVTIVLWGANDGIEQVLIQPDGKIVVAGASQSAPSGNFGLARFNGNGSLDTSFGTGGKATVDFFGNNDGAYSAILLADGKILIGGYSFFGAEERDVNFALARFDANGSLDASFGTNGKTAVDFFGRRDEIRSLALQPDGKILAAGFITDTDFNDRDFGIARYSANGTLDTSFGNGGWTSTDFPSQFPSDDMAYDVAVQPNGKIVTAGLGAGNFALVRYLPNGAPDTSFGSGGRVTTAFASSSSEGKAVLIQPDGRIVAAGWSGLNIPPYTSYFTLARYLGDPVIPNRAPFDFDGDGKTDISIFRPSTGAWWVSSSSNNQTVASQFGSSSDKLTPGDFTGDGKADIAFFRPAEGFWYILRSENASFYGFPFGSPGDIPVPADYDGDGKIDPAVYRPSNSGWYIQKSSGGIDSITFGISGDVPVAADYDGDGKADIAINRINNGNREWWIKRSTDAQVIAATFGETNDKTVQGDYTGDGKADIAFFRPSTGFWYILRSENGSFYGFPFGTSGDVPIPGDYDGDAKFDAAVFRPSNNGWYLMRSMSGAMSVQFGISGDQPVPNAFVR